MSRNRRNRGGGIAVDGATAPGRERAPTNPTWDPRGLVYITLLIRRYDWGFPKDSRRFPSAPRAFTDVRATGPGPAFTCRRATVGHQPPAAMPRNLVLPEPGSGTYLAAPCASSDEPDSPRFAASPRPC